MKMKKLYRCRWDKKIAGVCGGLGHFLGIDPTFVRLLFIFLCALTGILPLLIIYIVAWLIIPMGPSTYVQIKCRKLYRSITNRKIAGICGGFAEFLKIDPTLIRLIIVFAMIITGFVPILVSYVIGALIIPEKPRLPNHSNWV